MSYVTYETSAANSQPVLLFVFKYSGKTWYYTSADRELTLKGLTYTPIAITCGNFPGSTQTTKSNVEINIPIGNEVGELFRVCPPSEVVGVTVYCENLLDVDEQFIVCWKGRITGSRWEPTYIALTSESVFVSLQRQGLQLRFSKQCITYIYSGKCKLDPLDYEVIAPCGLINNRTLTVPSLICTDDNYFAGGYVTWVNNLNGNTEVRGIRSSFSATGNLTLASAPVNLTQGMSLKIYPGCDHTLTTCDKKFGNAINYRGTPYIPSKCPFGGTALY